MKNKIVLVKEHPPTLIFEVDCDETGNGIGDEESYAEMDKAVKMFANKRVKLTIEVVGEATDDETQP